MMHCVTNNLTPRFVRFTSGQVILAPISANRMGEEMVRE
jgi:hypothetical protein